MTVQPLFRQTDCKPARPRFVRTMTPGCGWPERTCPMVDKRPPRTPWAAAGCPQNPKVTRRMRSPMRCFMAGNCSFAADRFDHSLKTVACYSLTLPGAIDLDNGTDAPFWYPQIQTFFPVPRFWVPTFPIKLFVSAT